MARLLRIAYPQRLLSRKLPGNDRREIYKNDQTELNFWINLDLIRQSTE
jgi:hypothetical protein